MATLLQSSVPGCLIPAYVSITQTDWWNWVQSIKTTYPATPLAVIINPASAPGGAGSSTNPSWTSRINSLRNVGIIVLGYVDTAGSATPTATVQQRIADWKNLYPAIDGIYFDNVSIDSTTTAATDYLATVGGYAKNTAGFQTTAANCKVAANLVRDSWHSQGVPIDTFVIYDGPGLDTIDTSYTKYSGVVNKNQIAYFGNTAPTIDQNWTSQMAQYAGWIYYTPNSNFNSFPSNLGHLVRLLDNIRAGRLVGGSAQDKWGIDKVYHDKIGGTQRFMNREDIFDDPDIDNIDGDEGISKLPNGHWRATGGGNAWLRVELWTPQISPDSARLAARFHNVEITVYARVHSQFGDPPYAWQLYSRGGHHGNPTNCEGSALKARFSRANNEVMFVKEVCHSCYCDNRGRANGKLASGRSFGDGRWYGAKFVIYNVVEGGNTYSKQEIYVDPECTDASGNLVIGNNWVFASSYIDRGDWFCNESRYERDCGGCAYARNEILTEPGGRFTSGTNRFHCNLAAYRTDEETTDFDYLSAREIDPTKPVATTPTPSEPTNPEPPAAPGTTGPGPGPGEPEEPTPQPGHDIFNVKKIFPTKQNGYEFFMDRSNVRSNLNRFNPKIISASDLNRNGDGSWKVTQTGTPVTMQVYQRNGYNPVTSANSALNQQIMHSRGYMQSPDDLRNIEATVYVKLNSTIAPDDFFWLARGGEHNKNIPNCEGVALRGHFGIDSSTQMQKEQWHVATVAENRKNVLGVNIIGKWVGVKFIVLNKSINGVLVTSQQLWVDINNTNTWQKVDERTDAGGWGNQGFQCGGLADQLVSWGGPMVQFGWTTFSNVDFDKLSVREIDPAGVPIDAPPPDPAGSCAGV